MHNDRIDADMHVLYALSFFTDPCHLRTLKLHRCLSNPWRPFLIRKCSLLRSVRQFIRRSGQKKSQRKLYKAFDSHTVLFLPAKLCKLNVLGGEKVLPKGERRCRCGTAPVHDQEDARSVHSRGNLLMCPDLRRHNGRGQKPVWPVSANLQVDVKKDSHVANVLLILLLFIGF